ncbi:HET-domain-containing protein [Fusarium austroafricanum]|uniref:HET-domain-containing protein n=1 Tax=Fusarium austroafricanum TaxID=2364996 RepID=A0A8H4KHZ8_9HYPO|nr:HET-domain-containing protein [Fusarium austroafricanum]
MKLPAIKVWYDECIQSHSKCAKFPEITAPSSQGPSRLLHLQDGKIKLVCDIEKGPQIKYATLSHMWGSNPSAYPQLTRVCLEDFTISISQDNFPDKYLDAMRVSKALGLDYLWIDSLCIIQDDPEDWKKEALKMADVYGNTACNISYIFPPSDKPNKEHLRDPRVEIPCQIMGDASGSEADSGHARLVVQEVAGCLTRGWAPTSYKDAWPLLSRAWVFQESLLCPRNIYYGQSRLMWECCEKLQDELCGELHETTSSKMLLQSSNFSHETVMDNRFFRIFYSSWHSAIRTYRLLDLSFESDRAMAFAGITKAVQTLTGFTYLAGILGEAIAFDLLWCISSPSLLRAAHGKGLSNIKAPTWSWFSVPPGASVGSRSEDTIGFNICSQMELNSKRCTYTATLIDRYSFKHDSDSQAYLHDFAGLRIKFKTHRIPCKLQWDNKILRLLPHGKFELAERYEPEPKNGMKYIHDDVMLLSDSTPPQETCMILMIFECWMTEGATQCSYDMSKVSDKRLSRNTSTHWQYAGLVIEPAGPFWKRIGVFIFDNSVQGATPIPCAFDLKHDEEEVSLI